MPAASAAAVVLAHAGGAPGGAMIGLPLLIFAGFCVAERRARRREQAEKAEKADGSVPGGSGGDEEA